MPSMLPQSLRGHLDFAEAFNAFGRALLPDEWNGSEVSPPGWGSVLPLEETAMQDEADRLRAILNHRYSDNDIRHIFVMNEYTVDWDTEYLARDQHDSNNWPEAVARLHSLIGVMSENPAWRTQAVADLRALHDRRQKVLTEILTLLADGRLLSFCEDGHIRMPIEAKRWAVKELRVDIAASNADCCPSATVVFHKKDFAAIIRQIGQYGGELTKFGAANAAEAELIRLMSDPNQRPVMKKSVFADFQKRWPNLSKRDFELRWKVACERTKSGWNKAGRRKEAASTPIGQQSTQETSH